MLFKPAVLDAHHLEADQQAHALITNVGKAVS
jgi:hypothetical protein